MAASFGGQDVALRSPACRLGAGVVHEEPMREAIVQYGVCVSDFSSHYGCDDSMSYTAPNLAGHPSVRTYGDSPWTFVLRTYGPWWDMAPSAGRRFKEQAHHKIVLQDFAELAFEHKVYPVKLEIFETYNPGAVVRILALDGVSQRWDILWCANHVERGLPAKSRIFSPPLNKLKFPADLIRLEFYHRHLDYHTELDAVRMTGTVEPSHTLSPTNNLYACYYPSHVIGLNAVCSRLENLAFIVKPSNTVTSSQLFASSKENYFEQLPLEVIHLIASYLDLPSLCRLSCVSRTLKRLCYDPLLYTELGLQPYWHKVNESTLCGLEKRCQSLQFLSLAWCGGWQTAFVSAVIKFVGVCGNHLVCLCLANCRFVNNEFLVALATVALQLEELDLHNCYQPYLDDVGFRQIAHFHKLKWLSVYRTKIDLLSALLIVRSCESLEFLNLGACVAITNFDEVAFEIERCCRRLRGLNFWRASSLTAAGVTALANVCSSLEDLDLGWCLNVYCTSGCIVHLAEKCSHLKRLCLSALRTVCDNDILSLAANCPKLEQLDIFGTREVGVSSCVRL